MAKADFFFFEWEVCSDGYHFLPHPRYTARRADPERRPTLLEDPELNKDNPVAVAKSERQTKYNPFDKKYRGLARTFSELFDAQTNNLDEKRVLTFINRYGVLGLYEENMAEWHRCAASFQKIYQYVDGTDRLDYARAVTFFNGTRDLPVKIIPFIYGKPEPKQARLLSKNGSTMHFRPGNLLSALYMLLGNDLTQGIDLQRCADPACFEWFPRTTTKKYCCKACGRRSNRAE